VRSTSWKVALFGVAALGSASVGQSKVIVLDTSANTGWNTSGALTNFSQPFDDNAHYVQSAYIERPYGILSRPAAISANHESAGARLGMESFRQLSNNDARERVNGGTKDSFMSILSRSDDGTGIADACVTLLILCGLAGYQLRRKQQLLKRLPSSA
jgi:hypothetical protein